MSNTSDGVDERQMRGRRSYSGLSVGARPTVCLPGNAAVDEGTPFSRSRTVGRSVGRVFEQAWWHCGLLALPTGPQGSFVGSGWAPQVEPAARSGLEPGTLTTGGPPAVVAGRCDSGPAHPAQPASYANGFLGRCNSANLAQLLVWRTFAKARRTEQRGGQRTLRASALEVGSSRLLTS